ncbi:hypothetical protein BCR44DRAFT_58878 [Catenaria anguillulae PL171]|uniref:Uncharacterized protein n=1 Tax=Catenaria anguillulae PL171 TaxID=765915 RepID=A0A1Y2HAF6_9FUNG|nr:hypothetical protein BCR44DRAFT_58878 [Catenaria anguillulae PL171]
MHPTTSIASSASAPAAAAPTPEERLLWLTSETSRLGSNVHSLNPAIDDLTSTAAAELAGATDLDLDVLLGSLPDLSSAPTSVIGAPAAPPPPPPSTAAPALAPGGMPPLSHDAIMALLQHPNAMAMLAAVQGAGPSAPGSHPEWSQLGVGAGQGQGKLASPAAASAATAPSPNLGDLSAFLSFESDNDGDAAMGD